jgi:hypothetical protein
VLSEESGWYEIVESATLRQGDLLTKCPVPIVTGLDTKAPSANDNLIVDVELRSVLVISQSCDLENNKISNVLVASVMDWASAEPEMVAAGNTLAKGKQYRQSLISGHLPGFALLRKHESLPLLRWSIVDFHKLFVVRKSTVSYHAANSGPRLRLMSPYREHIAQEFARYFMRVGLPVDASSFVKEGAEA